MKFRKLAVLSTFYSLEEFPTHLGAEKSDLLLACWACLWHPGLIHAAASVPQWMYAVSDEESFGGALLVAPTDEEEELAGEALVAACREDARLIHGTPCRTTMTEAALQLLDDRTGADAVDPEIVADFQALGFCQLQIELMTRQLRYATTLDEVRFNEALIQAAAAVMEGTSLENVRSRISECFDILAEENDNYYPMDIHLLDLTLLAESTLGQPLRHESGWVEAPANILASGATIRHLAQTQPETLAKLRDDVANGKVGLVGGEMHELAPGLDGREAMLQQFRQGRAVWKEHLHRVPTIFGRRRFGLSPVLPCILDQFGYDGAIHATFDGGRFPNSPQAKFSWKGDGDAHVDSLGCTPLDASRADTFLDFGLKIGEAMDSDHIPTLVLAHWPGMTAHAYEDLRRVARYGTMLGNFMTVEDYFETTQYGSESRSFDADEYYSPYLHQAVTSHEADPISSQATRCRGAYQIRTAQTFETWTQMLGGDVISQENDLSTEERVRTAADSAAAALFGRSSQSKPLGVVVLNAGDSAARTVIEHLEVGKLVTDDPSVFAVSAVEEENRRIIASVPACGFSRVPLASSSHQSKPVIRRPRDEPVMVDGYSILNEYFEAHICPETGTLRALCDFKTRGARLSQRLAYCEPGSDAQMVMQADSVEVTCADTTRGEVVSIGKLLDAASRVTADFRQTYRAIRGSRTLEIDVELTPRRELTGNPWQSYYAVRWAWAHDSAELTRDECGVRVPVASNRLEAPLMLHIDESSRTTALLFGGHCWHRRIGGRMLDTLLVVRGETSGHFRLGVAVEPSSPIRDAIQFLSPPQWLEDTYSNEPTSGSGWLFHVDARNVIATDWSPLTDEQGQVVGVSVRLLETAGLKTKAAIRAFVPIGSARKVDFLGNKIADCPVHSDAVSILLTPRQWCQVEIFG